ncbi:MAG: hypothetical protein WBP61_10635 [Nocardioides sp.]
MADRVSVRVGAPLVAALLLAATVLLPVAPAHAAGRVVVANSDGDAKIDPTYATTVRVSGSGFQSVTGGHGGVYVFFGTVKPGWQPSRGGATGADYYYVPDSEAKNNQGFQRYVAFPGSDTAGSANGGVMSESGSWSTQLVVPGAVFKAYDRRGGVRTIDCRQVTCGVITVGAHGVANATNESFTPVSVGSLTGQSAAPATTAAPSGSTTAPATGPSTAPDDDSAAPPAAGDPAPARPAAIEVDRAAAVAGNVVAFNASGLPPGAQVSAVFDDGAAGAGPFVVASDGTLVGVIGLPAATSAGTHELRLYGVEDPPTVMFAVQASDTPSDAGAEPSSAGADDEMRAAWLFAGAAAIVLVVALVRLGLRRRGNRAT